MTRRSRTDVERSVLISCGTLKRVRGPTLTDMVFLSSYHKFSPATSTDVYMSMDMRGLHYTCIVAAAFLGLFFPACLYVGMRSDDDDDDDGQGGYVFLCFTLPLLVVAMHALVSGVWYMVDSWSFIDFTLFFVAWKRISWHFALRAHCSVPFLFSRTC
jgi:hypothetical protein